MTYAGAGLPLGVTSGAYSLLLDLTLASSWNPAFIAAQGGSIGSAETYFAAGRAAGKACFNIHTDLYHGGEVRGFLHQVPEPSSLALIALAFVALGATATHRPGTGQSDSVVSG